MQIELLFWGINKRASLYSSLLFCMLCGRLFEILKRKWRRKSDSHSQLTEAKLDFMSHDYQLIHYDAQKSCIKFYHICSIYTSVMKVPKLGKWINLKTSAIRKGRLGWENWQKWMEFHLNMQVSLEEGSLSKCHFWGSNISNSPIFLFTLS